MSQQIFFCGEALVCGALLIRMARKFVSESWTNKEWAGHDG